MTLGSAGIRPSCIGSKGSYCSTSRRSVRLKRLSVYSRPSIEPATSNAVDSDPLNCYQLTVRRDTEDFPLKSGPGGDAGHDLIAFGNLILNGMPCIREGS